MKVDNYPWLAGLHPELTAFRNAITQAGAAAPHTGKPFSEAMILGLSGGLGAGYILWEFKAHNQVILTLGFLNRWQYAVERFKNLGQRLNAAVSFHETGGKTKAAADLQQLLELNRVPVAWVDPGNLPYTMIPKSLEGYFGHVVNVVGVDPESDVVQIADRSEKPFIVTLADLAASRARIGSFKNRLMSVEAPAEPALTAAVRAGLDDCAAHLSSDSASFGLPAFQKWAGLLTNEKNKKGWMNIFGDGKALFSALRSLYEALTPYGSLSGGNLRGLYAEFLDEASGVLGNTALQDVAPAYRELDGQWAAFAEASFPDEIEAVSEVKKLVHRRHELMTRQGGEALAELAEIGATLEAREKLLNEEFPLGAGERAGLFEKMQSHLEEIHAAEVAAHQQLTGALA